MGFEIRPRLGVPPDEEVCTYREHGLEPVVLWLPSMASDEFAQEARRQFEVILKAAEQEREDTAWANALAEEVLDSPDWPWP